MFSKFFSDLSREIKAIFHQEQTKIKVWNDPHRTKKIKDTEIWIVEGSKDYCPVNVHDSVDNGCIYIRALYKGRWYMVNKHGCPVGAPYQDKYVDKWNKVSRIG